MSLFIAGQSFPDAADFDAAKIAIFIASAVAAVLGVGLLWWTGRESPAHLPDSAARALQPG
jgi:NhaA family Na+:H+ antiporter